MASSSKGDIASSSKGDEITDPTADSSGSSLTEWVLNALSTSLQDSSDSSACAPETLVTPRAAGSEASMTEHSAGRCDPCVFFNSTRGCADGRGCPFCHLEHAKIRVAGQHRPRKLTRDRIKDRIEQCLAAPPIQVHHLLQGEARKHPYARSLIRGYLDEQQQQAVLEHEPPRDEIIFL